VRRRDCFCLRRRGPARAPETKVARAQRNRDTVRKLPSPPKPNSSIERRDIRPTLGKVARCWRIRSALLFCFFLNKRQPLTFSVNPTDTLRSIYPSRIYYLPRNTIRAEIFRFLSKYFVRTNGRTFSRNIGLDIDIGSRNGRDMVGGARTSFR